jgi:hypothetical protein
VVMAVLHLGYSFTIHLRLPVSQLIQARQ